MHSKLPDIKIYARKAAKPAAFLLAYMLFCQLVTGTVCVMESSAGLPCPGCGLSRAWIAALHLRFREAFAWHPLFWLIPLMAVVWIGQWQWSRKRGIEASPRWFTKFLIVCLVLFLAAYAVRMAVYFPHTEPMVTNPDAVMWRIGRGIRWVWERVGANS